MALANNNLSNATAFQQNMLNQEAIRQARLNNQAKYLQMAQTTPYFALGNMIGNLLVDSYNSRGVNKEKKAISQALAGYSGEQNYPALNQILDNKPYEGVIDPNASIAVGPSLSLGDTPIQGVVDTNNSITIPQATTPNISSFDADKFKAQYYKDARTRGRTDAQIAEAWNSMQPEITELANKAKEARLDDAMKVLGGGDDGTTTFGEVSLSNPKYIQALRPVLKDNPELATILVNGAKAKDEQRASIAKQNALFAQQDKTQNALFNHQDRTQARQQAFTLQLHDIDNAIKLAIANGKVGKNGIVNDVKTAIAVGKAFDTLEKKYTITDPNDPMRPMVLPRTQWSKLDQQRAAQYEGLMGIGTQKVNTTKTANKNIQYEKLPNPNNYDLTLEEIDKAIAKLSQDPKKSKADIINDIRGQYAKTFKGNTGYVDQILQGMTDEEWKAYNVRGV